MNNRIIYKVHDKVTNVSPYHEPHTYFVSNHETKFAARSG